MKKIININLSGRVVPIEDSAYEKLQEYIESLRRYFANEEGRDEIINDIESRIAELMSEKVRKGADSITDTDVNEIANSMGRPEDFEGEEIKEQSYSSASTAQQFAQTEAPPKVKRGLYRDTSDKFLGGVCSGIAAYLNVDPAIVRILFAIITFGGFGLGFLAYIILWIVLPARDVEGYTGKRLFRNPEGKMIGGVCTGLAAYFNKKTSTIRIIFLAPILLNILINLLNGFGSNSDFIFFPNIVFGSLTSTFVVAYIILWIVLPEARSPYEKMEMRGEKVDVNTIKQNVQDRAKDFSEEVKSAAQNFSAKAKEFAQTQGKTFATEVRQVSRPIGSGIGHAIAVLFKVFFLFIAGTIALALFGVLMAAIFGGLAWWPVNDYLWTNRSQPLFAWGTLILFLGVPLIGFLVWIIRRVIGVKSRSSYLGWIFGGLWALGWVSVILLVSAVARETRYFENAEPPTVIPISQPANKLTVMVSQPVLEFTDRFWWADNDSEGWNIDEDSLKLSLVDFTVEKSLDADYHVTLVKKSMGRSLNDARQRAAQIQYSISSKDSILDIGNGFAISKDSKYRGQMIELKIQVPVGKKLRFDETVTRKLNPVEIRMNNRRSTLRRARIDIDYNDWFEYRANVDYVMTENGTLVDPNNPQKVPAAPTPPTGDYRYEDAQPPTTDSIEQQRKRVEEEQRKLKDMEKKKDSIRGNGKLESLDDNDETDVAGSPVFSLIQIFH
ncbi:MAG TPA: PspC domain-containing protein [Chitinophagaceae bacterium]|jgi:phage shock protein PspC (stress-responsive transcriptional regulator)|nr:PspC domain-containing protein [Chitinophagaceae bacterium]